MEHRIFTHYILIVYILLSAVLPVCAASADARIPEISQLLDSLDSELGRSEERQAARRSEIEAMRRKLATAADDEQRYWIAREIYEANSTFDSDSALVYAGLCHRLAERLGRRDWMDEMNLNRTYIYSATGLLSHAEKCLAEVDTARLQGSALTEYYKVRLFLETHRDQFLGRNTVVVYQPEVDEFLTRQCKNLPDDDPYYFWLNGWHSLSDSLRASRLRPKIEEMLSRSSYSTVSDAKNAWMLSRLCELAGDSIGKMRNLILSAIADTRACNREIASLEELGAILYSKGDYERANAYLSHSIKCANSYKSRVRVGNLANLQDLVFNALKTANSRQMDTLKKYMLWILFISIVLGVSLIFIGLQLRQQNRTRRALNRTKQNLEERVGELQNVRTELELANAKLSQLYETERKSTRELAEVNDAKEKYIANIFSICSSYINKIDDFRKNIYRMIMAKRIDDIFELVKSPELSHGEIKELYSNFDRIFLELYPDFVKDFNTLLRPDEQISVKRGELLNTELRIYALVRLGMNDSVKIAQFLHCSVQTVYNTRQRARNKAAVPRDTFAESVRALGKPTI